MRYLVTGAAGFIGSHLCERLLNLEHDVTGIDCFVPYYPKAIKERNLMEASRHLRYRFQPLDLRTDDLKPALDGVDVIFRLAAMPGLVASWTEFDLYQSCNLTATQRLLEAIKGMRSLKRFVYGPTSNVYGKFASGDETLPMLHDIPPECFRSYSNSYSYSSSPRGLGSQAHRIVPAESILT